MMKKISMITKFNISVFPALSTGPNCCPDAGFQSLCYFRDSEADPMSCLLDKDGSPLYLPLRKPLKPNPSTCDQSRDPSIHMSVGRNLSYLSLLRILYLPGIIARAWINLHVQYSCVGVWSSEKPRKPRHSFIKLWFLTMSMSYLHVIKSLSKISGSKKIYITIYICIYPRILSSFFVMNKCALNKQFVTSYLRTRFSNI